MPTRLIINADDFGLTHGVNRAIVELFRAGAVSSATLMANGAAFQDAVELAKQYPGLGVGCHLVLTDGVPLSPPASIPSLLEQTPYSEKPRLRSSLVSFARAAIFGRLKPEEIEREVTGQIMRLLEAGLSVTHVDTHKHTHLFPGVLRPIIRVLERLGIRAIRNPFEQPWSLRLGAGVRLRRLQIHTLNRLEPFFLRQASITSGAVGTTNGTLGVSATGQLDKLSLGKLLNALPEGTWELVCHPGYNDTDLDAVTTRLRGHRQVERDALMALVPRSLARRSDVSLVSFAEIAAAPGMTGRMNGLDTQLSTHGSSSHAGLGEGSPS